jgi:hypothetical protein
MIREPIWRTVLNWTAVITFFVLPAILFVTQIWVYPNLEQEKAHLDYLREFMRNVTFLVFGLAGLKTWEVIKANGREKKQEGRQEAQDQPAPRPPRTV